MEEVVWTREACCIESWDDKWGKRLGESDKGKVVQVMCNVSSNDGLTDPIPLHLSLLFFCQIIFSRYNFSYVSQESIVRFYI